MKGSGGELSCPVTEGKGKKSTENLYTLGLQNQARKVPDEKCNAKKFCFPTQVKTSTIIGKKTNRAIFHQGELGELSEKLLFLIM